MYKKICAAVALGTIFAASAPFAFAQEQTVESLQKQLIILMETIKKLQAERDAGTWTRPGASGGEVADAARCLVLSRTLGLESDDASTDGEVSKLQKFLAALPGIYPEGRVTGFFGPATERAVQRWQKQMSIISSGDADSTGYGLVGRKTRLMLSCDEGQAPTTPEPYVPPATTPPVVVATTTPPSAGVPTCSIWADPKQPAPNTAYTIAWSISGGGIGTLKYWSNAADAVDGWKTLAVGASATGSFVETTGRPEGPAFYALTVSNPSGSSQCQVTPFVTNPRPAAKVTSTTRSFPTTSVSFSGTAVNTASVGGGTTAAAGEDNANGRIVPVVNGTWKWETTLPQGSYVFNLWAPGTTVPVMLDTVGFTVISPSQYLTLRAYVNNVLTHQAENVPRSNAYNYCSITLAAQNPTQELRCTWGDSVIYTRAGTQTATSTPPVTETDSTGTYATYRGYMDGALFIETKNITRAAALENCMLNANNNPTRAVRCTWNDIEIYNRAATVTYSQASYTPTYSQASYYAQASYTPAYSQASYYAQASYTPTYSQASYYAQGSYTTRTRDIKINGSDGPITLADQQAVSVTWTSSGYTKCGIYALWPELGADYANLPDAGLSGSRTMYAYAPYSPVNVIFRCQTTSDSGSPIIEDDTIQVIKATTSATPNTSQLAATLTALEEALKALISMVR